jgi:hypothetical protein
MNYSIHIVVLGDVVAGCEFGCLILDGPVTWTWTRLTRGFAHEHRHHLGLGTPRAR